MYFGGNGQGGEPLHSYTVSRSAGACTSLSWDNNGNLWAAAGPHLWVLRQHRAPQLVALPAAPGIGLGGLRVLALRMAPDGVRAALLVKTSSGTQILLGAVSFGPSGAAFGSAVTVGPGLSDATSLSWYDPYHLVVLAGGEIYEVPLTGAAGTLLGQAPDGTQTLTTNGIALVTGTAAGQILVSTNSALTWHPQTVGSDPVFPG